MGMIGADNLSVCSLILEKVKGWWTAVCQFCSCIRFVYIFFWPLSLLWIIIQLHQLLHFPTCSWLVWENCSLVKGTEFLLHSAWSPMRALIPVCCWYRSICKVCIKRDLSTCQRKYFNFINLGLVKENPLVSSFEGSLERRLQSNSLKENYNLNFITI